MFNEKLASMKYLAKTKWNHPCGPTEAMNLTVTMLNPIQSPRIPPEFATNQMTGIFWSLLKRTFLNIQCDGARPVGSGVCWVLRSSNLVIRLVMHDNLSPGSSSPYLRDHRVLDVDVDECEVVPAVAVDEPHQLRHPGLLLPPPLAVRHLGPVVTTQPLGSGALGPGYNADMEILLIFFKSVVHCPLLCKDHWHCHVMDHFSTDQISSMPCYLLQRPG